MLHNLWLTAAPGPRLSVSSQSADVGDGNEGQRAVAEAVRDKCEVDGCEFVLLLGDNLYPGGAESTDDPIWQEDFEQPYADVDLPFYAVLGNHDYGGKLIGIRYGGLGNEFERGANEVNYSQVSDKWNMPASFYTLRFGSLGIVALDTNSIMWGNTDNGDQATWIDSAFASVADAPWVMAAGHHPYRSNGYHGNAGEYQIVDGISLPIAISQIDGAEIKTFFDERVCGRADLYLSGHDHNRQWLDEAELCGGTELIVNGAGSSVTDLGDNGNTARWQDDSKLGFLYVEVDASTFTGTFIDDAGQVEYSYTLSK